jgi:hypothetical protein
LYEADFKKVNVELVLRTAAIAAHPVGPMRFPGSLSQSVIVYRAYDIEPSEEVDSSTSAITTASSQLRLHWSKSRLLKQMLVRSAAAKALMPSRDVCVDSNLK